VIVDYLDRHLLNPKFSEVYIGYTSFTRKKIATSNTGIWVGYRNGEPFFEMRFRYAFPKGKFSQDIWTHFKAVTFLCDNIWRHTSSPPLILVSSKRAVTFIQGQGYKWLPIGEQEKAKMYFWLDTLTPQIESYDALTPPFSLLRELMLEDSQHVSKKVAEKSFVDFTDLNVVE
jgi:hypothetical protein